MKANLDNLNTQTATISDEKGQSLIEFVFLMATMILISFLLLKAFNTGVGKVWLTYINAIAKPTASPIQLR